uniref:Putative snare protein tlg2/syntaxin 16 n=1 Tax=Rhipicephalus microplus TaxID=6941 RepID=A0A6G5A8G4_RHIMP
MVTRSLTEAFVLMRNNALQSKHIFGDHVHEDTVALVGRDVETGMGIYKDVAEPPRWIDALEEVNYQMTKIRDKLKELSALHDRHLNRPTFDESSLEEDEIEQTTHQLAQLFSHCQQLLSVIQQGVQHGSNAKEAHLAQNVVRSVASSLQSLSSSFRSSQTTYCKRLQSREEHSNKFFDVPFYMEETQLSPERFGGDHQLQMEDQLFLEDNTEMVQIREREINNILRSITELNFIFKDIANMVAEQVCLCVY